MKTPSKENILQSLRSFIAMRSGIVWADYQTSDYQESNRAYNSDYRTIVKHGADARKLLEFVSSHESITADNIVSSSSACRLQIVRNAKGVFCDYTTGQYFATEYRAGACQFLAAVIWDWLRDQCGYKTGDEIRKAARNNFGRGMASRWFN